MADAERRLAALEAEVAELRRVVRTAALSSIVLSLEWDEGYQAGRESVLGRQAAAAALRQRHLRVAEGPAS